MTVDEMIEKGLVQEMMKKGVNPEWLLWKEWHDNHKERYGAPSEIDDRRQIASQAFYYWEREIHEMVKAVRRRIRYSKSVEQIDKLSQDVIAKLEGRGGNMPDQAG